MKKLIKLLAVVVLASICFAVPSNTLANSDESKIELLTINGKKYVRTFYDEFGGTELNKKNWTFAPEWSRQNGYCKWSNSMTELDGKGHLILKCDYDENNNLLCGAIRSRDYFDQRYGLFEIKAKLQSTEGFWSAFWLMPYNIDSGLLGGADGTEIDIFEAFNVKNKKINHAVHYDGYGNKHKSAGTAVTADVYDGEYHIFSLEWDENEYIFYIDNKETYRINRQTSDSSGCLVEPCRVPAYLKISLESGSWTGKPKAEELPDCLTVDYVRVYQRANYYSIDNIILGDINLDCEVKVDDVKCFIDFLAKDNRSIPVKNSDLYKDSKIDMKDCLILKKYLTGKITSLPYRK